MSVCDEATVPDKPRVDIRQAMLAVAGDAARHIDRLGICWMLCMLSVLLQNRRSSSTGLTCYGRDACGGANQCESRRVAGAGIRAADRDGRGSCAARGSGSTCFRERATVSQFVAGMGVRTDYKQQEILSRPVVE